VAEVEAIYDKGTGAVVVVTARTVDAEERPVFDNRFTIFARGEGGFGGERGPELPRLSPPEGAPDFEITEATTAEQALLYRLSGDLNPLHADHEAARAGGFDRPILHGLCTFGFVGRAILSGACGGDPRRFKSLSARFTGAVFPGDTLTTRGFRRDGSWLVTVTTQDGRPVLSNAVAEIN
jgi:acyl dehydratase